MADVMTFPKTIEEFINNHSFKDSKEVYTNGTELIPVFRVEQALEHYVQEIRNKAIEEFAEKCNQKITEFILEHKNQLDFVSGVAMGWKIIDEIAESMKGEK